ncbi:protein phosphatase 4 core regulatory subunit R2 [Purpureocillium lavendulum]|uniref:Protein phosphatase 4 core regulatory subunit R2 n=1 Tax=Purpureocillium lavendulum TaxID=1247861 RepID=A0AB34FU71_9HYPO|nr:protein phosphatase 4 core regulatory subunit R2 [Purpureocillium lavendulum]
MSTLGESGTPGPGDRWRTSHPYASIGAGAPLSAAPLLPGLAQAQVDTDTEALGKIACGSPVQEGSWPTLRTDILSRLDKSSSQEANKENDPGDGKAPDAGPEPASQSLAPGELPPQIDDLLAGIRTHLETFNTYAPHTIQRLAELVVSPRAHYKALASYLHAVDRVVQVTSGTDIYPLPPAVPDMSAMSGAAAAGLANGEEGGAARDPAATVAWSNPTTAPLGSDEALGGALLTPIPWLTRRSPESSNGDTTPGAGAQIHSEGTETIDGPNGMGSIETVSVSVNGVPSTGHARGVTQGELLRQEQRAGVVPVSQLSRGPGAGPASNSHEATSDEDRNMEGGAVGGNGNEGGDEEEEETPHARGPEEIGVGDTGPQVPTTSHMGEDGVEMQGIDVAAAVGRRQEDDSVAHPSGATAAAAAAASEAAESAASEDSDTDMRSPGADSTGTKREAEQPLEGEPHKKLKESGPDEDPTTATTTTSTPGEDASGGGGGGGGGGEQQEVASEDAAPAAINKEAAPVPGGEQEQGGGPTDGDDKMDEEAGASA